MRHCRTAVLRTAAEWGVSSLWAKCHLTTGQEHSRGSNRDLSKMSFGIDPEKLELNLNLDTMDFAKVAEATQEAISHEKSNSRFHKAENQVTDSSVRQEQTKAEVPGENAAAPGHPNEPSFATGGRTIRGIVGAGDVHDANTPAAAYAQRRREGQGLSNTRDIRYTLMDSLRDCSMSGNWLKSYKIFDSAVEKAYKMILTPCANDRGEESADGASQPSVQSGDRRGAAKEKEIWAALSKINAALPPRSTGTMDRSSDVARRRGMSNMSGVMRWNGGHFYLVLKTLLEAERVEEAERVWSVMKGIGFVQYQLDERSLNALMGLLRRSKEGDDATQQLVTPIVAPQKVAEQLEKEKTLKRQMIIELGDAARARNLRLRGSNGRTAAVARIAEAVHAQGDGDERPPSDDTSNLRVGDFKALLRIAQSHEGTLRVLAMMKKLGIDRDAGTYASIIASHRSPTYRVEGASDEEIAIAHGDTEDTEDTENMSAAGGGERGVTSEDSKKVYEAYKEKRIASAKRWFQQCPVEHRTASLFNEMLYLLRASSHQAEFAALLTEFRGNALRSPEDWARIDAINAKREEARRRRKQCAEETSVAERGEFSTLLQKPPPSPVLLSASWRVPPDGRTYELLIRRCRYLHDWEGVWELFREMQARNTRGTAKLYQMLLVDAKTHPPASVARHGDVSSFVMEVYKEMRRNNVDATSVDSTLSLVNAWSATRSKRRWL